MCRILPLSSARDCGTAPARFIRSRRVPTSCASLIASANYRSSISIARRCSEGAVMDEFDRFLIRERALRRARLPSGQARDLWGFERWGDGPTQGHHPGRRKFSKEVTIIVPTAMHNELTRRGEEEHPPLGPDPDNRLEREA